MRKGYSLLLLLLCFVGASAQNWAPINTTDKYNYKLDTASAISHTLWVDSVQVVGGDTVYFMNRIVLMPTFCASCSQNGKTLMNQPQFLQKMVVHEPTGIYHFRQPSNLYFNPDALLNDIMLYDTANNITATVTLIDTMTVLGQVDTIKIYKLSNGDSITASKNYGIVNYPTDDGSHRYYHLVGIEGGRNVGEHVAKFKDFFNFQVGDEFIYDTRYADAVNIPYINEEFYQRVQVKDFTYNGDTITIKDSVSGVLVTALLRDSSVRDVNLYPNTMMRVSRSIAPDFAAFAYNGIVLDKMWNGYNFINVNVDNGQYFIGSYSYKDSNAIVVKTMNIIFAKDSLNIGDTINYYFRGQGIDDYRVFKERLGLTNYHGNTSETGSDINLFAYKLAGTNTWVYDSTYYINVGVNEINLNPQSFTIQPNPITTQLIILLPETTNATIRLLDLKGREVLVQQSNDIHFAINTASLPSGLYIVEVRTNEGIGRKKVVKM